MVKVRKLSLVISAALIASTIATGGTVSAKGNGDAVSFLSATQSYKDVNVTIDGKLQQFDQSAIIKNGSTLVPLRGVFEALKAEVAWDQATKTVTATKGSTVIVLTIGKSTATVDGKQVALSAKAEVINGSTMIPLRFVAEALGAKVGWDASTNTAVITSKGATTELQTVNGIKVLYGKHTYGSKNQKEYDMVMEIVNKKVATIDSVPLDVSGRYEQEFNDYLYKGDRAENYPEGSYEYRGLKLANVKFGPLLAAGLTVDEVVQAYKTSLMAASFMGDVTNPRNGSPKSAYDNLVNKISDCDSDAYVYSAVFDAMGYNSAVIASTNHAEVIVKLGDTWYGTMGGDFGKISVAKALKDGAHMLSQPTYGSELKK